MKLYIYEHCPYCVRVLMFIKTESLPIDIIVLQNDDEKTPIKMIGKKLVPILEFEAGQYMPESLDIIAFLSTHFEKPIKQTKVDHQITSWINDSQTQVKALTFSYVAMHPFKEFVTESALMYFTNKKEAKVGSFKKIISERAVRLVALRAHLENLDNILASHLEVGSLTMNDIHLFPILRHLTLIPAIDLGINTEKYLKRMVDLTGCELYGEWS